MKKKYVIFAAAMVILSATIFKVTVANEAKIEIISSEGIKKPCVLCC